MPIESIGTPASLLAAPRWIYTQIPVATLQGAGASVTGTFPVITLPAKAIVHATKVVAEVALAGGAVSAATIQVGIGGTINQLFAAQSTFALGTFTSVTNQPKVYSESATQAIIATSTLTSDNHVNLTVGSIGVYLLVSDLAHI